MKRLLIMVMLLSASVMFFSCNNDDEDKTLSKEEVTATLNQLDDNLATYMDEMQNSEGIATMEVLMSLEDPFYTTVKSTSKSDVFSTINYYLTPKDPSNKVTFESEPFIFSEYTGTYTWNNSLYQWDYSADPSDKIILVFPSDTSQMEVNDATFTIHSYTEVQIIGFDYTYYNPTEIIADLYVMENKVVDLNMTASWYTTGDMAGEPTELDADIYVIPFTFHIDFAHESTSADINAWIRYNTEQIFSTGLGAVFQNETDSLPVNINGYVQLFNVKFEMSVDVAEIVPIVLSGYIFGNLNTPDKIEEINSHIDANVTIDGQHAADIVLGSINMNPLDGEMPLEILFVYNDGTSESALQYFENFAADLEDFFSFLDEFYN